MGVALARCPRTGLEEVRSFPFIRTLFHQLGNEEWEEEDDWDEEEDDWDDDDDWDDEDDEDWEEEEWEEEDWEDDVEELARRPRRGRTRS